MCFGCGPKNGLGLHLECRASREECVTEYVVRPEHQGFGEVAHGGVLAAVLDEAMAWLLWYRGYPALTVQLDVRYKRLVRVGEKLTVTASFVKDAGRLLECHAEARAEDGQVAARARAKFLRGEMDEANDNK